MTPHLRARPGWRLLAALGTIEMTALTAIGWGGAATPAALPWLLVAIGAYGAALWVARHGRYSLRLVLALGICARLILVAAPPTLSSDVYRYVWDGVAQQAGLNPYHVTPGEPALAAVHTPETRRAEHQTLPTIYPPGAQWFFWTVTGIAPSVLAMKAVLTLCDLGIIALLVRAGAPVVLYAWHPLVLLEVAGNGHVDVLGTLLLVAAFLAHRRRSGWLTALALAASIAVKFLPSVVAPLLWRRVGWWHAGAAAALIGVLWLPFVRSGELIALGSLDVYLARWRFNAPVFGALETLAPYRVVAGAALVIGLLTAVAARRAWGSESFPAWAWPIAAVLLAAPAVYPWYLLWLTPFLGDRRTLPLLVWSVSVLLTYAVIGAASSTGTWVLPGWVMPVEYGAVLIAAAVTFRGRALRQPEMEPA